MRVTRAQSLQAIDFMSLDALNNYELYSQARVTPKIINRGPITHYPILVAAERGVSISAESVHGTCDSALATPLGEPREGLMWVEVEK